MPQNAGKPKKINSIALAVEINQEINAKNQGRPLTYISPKNVSIFCPLIIISTAYCYPLIKKGRFTVSIR
jgi:hypothetical protein